VVLHLDMDAFYASVEQRDNPKLRGKPVIVGSPPSQRGVVCAASYEARKFGVRSAMPSATAGRLCPSGVFLRPRMDAYREESRHIMSLVRDLAGDRIQQVSVDEAYVEPPIEGRFSSHDHALQAAEPLARRIQASIAEQRGLTATVGIASNKLLAKLASDFQKPRGLTLVLESGKEAFLRPLPVRALHGVGPATEGHLHRANLRTVGDIQDTQMDLRPYVGSWAEELKRFAHGQDHRPLDLGDEIKSISSETTFLQDTDDRPRLRAALREQAAEISAKLARYGIKARTVQVKVRYTNFTTLTRQCSMEDTVQSASDIYRIGCSLLGRHQLVKSPLRLIGLGVSGLTDPTQEQLILPL